MPLHQFHQSQKRKYPVKFYRILPDKGILQGTVIRVRYIPITLDNVVYWFKVIISTELKMLQFMTQCLDTPI